MFRSAARPDPDHIGIHARSIAWSPDRHWDWLSLIGFRGQDSSIHAQSKSHGSPWCSMFCWLSTLFLRLLPIHI